MGTVQTTYTENIGDGKAGMIASTSNCDTFSAEVETTAGIAFGVAVHQGAAADQIDVGVDGAAAAPFAVSKYLGITVRDRTRPAEDEEYKKGAIATVITKGDVWVKVGAAVAAGDDVTVKEATGVLSSAAAADGQFLLPNARFLTAAAANGLAKVRLDTPQVGKA